MRNPALIELWPRLRFLGGAGTVTGSKFLLTYGEESILVDCGLFQGLKELRLKNWDRFPVDPARISAVVLTHAHLDHCGYLPRLVKEGFRGRIHCTSATARLCRIILLDAAHLNEEDTRYLSEKGLSKHRPALPLFDTADVERCLERFSPEPFGKPFRVGREFRATLGYAGHLLGAASPLIEVAGRRILFSGDLGREGDPIMNPPAPPPPADYVVVESTYGDRRHPEVDPREALGRIIRKCAGRGGVLLVPAFAVGRSQTLIHLIAELRKTGRIPGVPVYLNSPMAAEATELFCGMQKDHRLGPDECRAIERAVSCVDTVEESKALNRATGPKVILSASGMLAGGRILHHLRAFAPDPRNAIALTGYQAAGTRGRALADGAETLSIFGQAVPIGAEVVRLENLSAHADAGEILGWLKRAPSRPKKLFVVHGEPPAAEALRETVASALGWDAVAPRPGQEFHLV